LKAGERKGCQLEEVHHCGTGACGWDRMCGAVRASPLLRSLLICQVACRLEWCIAAKTQRGNQQWNSSTPPGRGPRWTRASVGDLQRGLKGSFSTACATN